MTPPRHIAVWSSLLVAGIAGSWWVVDQAPPQPAGPAEAASPATVAAQAAPAVEPTAPPKFAVEGKQPLDTTLARTHNKADKAPDAPAGKPESEDGSQLKLALPDDMPTKVEERPTEAEERLAWAADILARQSSDAFDLTPEEQPHPEVESITLFNPDYGLNGFLKQQWISQRFGLQGGLGLNDERRINTEEGIRDDIAVGMGIILTF